MPPVEAIAGPELRAGREGQDVAHRSPRLRQPHRSVVARTEGRVRVEEAHAQLNARDRTLPSATGFCRPIAREYARQVEVLAEDHLAVGLSLVAEAVLADRTRRLEAHHGTALARAPVARAYVATDFDEVRQHL